MLTTPIRLPDLSQRLPRLTTERDGHAQACPMVLGRRDERMTVPAGEIVLP